MGVVERSAKPTQDLNALRRQIWELRSEYWYRKITTYPQVVEAAKAESQVFINKLTTPAEWTYRDLAVAAVCGAQVFGAFCLGEIYGRGRIVGYDVGVDRFNQLPKH